MAEPHPECEGVGLGALSGVCHMLGPHPAVQLSSPGKALRRGRHLAQV